MEKPNILYIHSHDTGRYIQPYGYAVPTPSLQRLAEEGMLFRQAFTTCPTCSPSRAGLLTGTAPHTCGMLGLAHRGWRLHDYSWHIIHTLRAQGYSSALCGHQHIAAAVEEIGYDRVIPGVDIHNNRNVADHASAFLREPHERPFFLSVGFFDTHREFPQQAGPLDDERYVRPPVPLPDTPENRSDMARFITSARRYDEGVGQVMKTLEISGLAQNTLVICTTDHGLAFPRMKCNLTDHGTGVMLLMRGPGGFTGGRVCDALVSQLDIFPTICDLAGAAKPERLQGKSLLPLIDGTSTQINDAVFSGVTFHACYEPMRSIRTARWRYIRRFHPRARPFLPNCDDSPAKDGLLGGGWREREDNESEQLFDLLFDPNEACNIVRQPGMGEVRAELEQRLSEWMHLTGDPLLKGAPELPEKFITNSIDDTSPGSAVIDRAAYMEMYGRESGA